jgi:hypothetical protein
MRVIRLHIVLSKGLWERCIKGTYLEALLDDETIIGLEVQTPDIDTLYDFTLAYLRDDDDDDFDDSVRRALICRFQPEYESMVDVSIEEDCPASLW